MNNVELLRKGYEHFAAGNLEAVLELWHPDIEWLECRSFPYIQGDGRFVGHQAVVGGVLAHLPNYIDNFRIAVDELFGSGDKVVMAGHYAGTWKETGKTFWANATHIWDVKDGKATRFFQAVDSAEIMNP